MENTDQQVVVFDDSVAATPSPRSSQPQPSEEIIRNLAAFLPKDQEDYVQIREDNQYYYVNIGLSKAVDQVYRPLYNRVHEIKDKFHGSLQELLTQLKTDQVTDTKPAVHTTPIKTRASKRSVPKSSSANKVIISRSKLTNSNDTTSSFISRDETLFRGTISKTTDEDSISPGAIADGIAKLQFELDFMTEMSIDPNNTVESSSSVKSVSTTITKTKKKKSKKNMASSFKTPFIANEESVSEQVTVIVEESIVSLQIDAGTGMKTRSRAQQENTLVSSATKVATSKSTRKGKAQAAASPKSLTKPQSGRLNRRRSKSASNATPSKAKGFDLSASGLHKAISLDKLNTASTASSPSTGSSRSVTPKRILPRRACPASPTTTSSVAARRQEMETSRQRRLMMSAEKSKNAEENKKALLDSRINAIKTKREKRMDKFAENKKAIDHEKEEKLKAAVGALPISAMTKAEARNAERRLKLAQMQLEQDAANEAKKNAAAAIQTTSKRTGAKAAKTTKLPKKQSKKAGGKKQQQPKPVEVEKEPTDVQHIHALNDVAGSVMSSIAKLSGINGKINETFTDGPEPNHPIYTPKADLSVLVGNSICAHGPTAVTPGKANSTFILSKTLQSKFNSTNNYEMTPPPRERSYEHNYDISQYIDSDDEEKQAEHDAAQCGKYVPKWCLGSAFVDRVHEQFGLPPDELAQWTRRLFPKPALPVPLEDMGLNVRESYVQRSSSVNWKTAAEIELALKNNQAQEQKL